MEDRIAGSEEENNFAAIKVIGVGDHIEIWDEAQWASENSSENTADITALLIKLGF